MFIIQFLTKLSRCIYGFLRLGTPISGGIIHRFKIPGQLKEKDLPIADLLKDIFILAPQ